ncbi:hypothetical protein EUGRSUZ_E01086 [Eucalyptus grandis]|uniref:Uncharacterized protein n=2 Tax=Eucalyptus grandis TaxID=71139 RepID=A0ACC3KU83_EUCGR|nr:hypothetical protein EUGRSUZ_E01086 [Eucalyptus grandis]
MSIPMPKSGNERSPSRSDSSTVPSLPLHFPMVFNFPISSSDDGETPALTPVASPQQSPACRCCGSVISRFDERQLQDRSRDRGAVGRMQDKNPMGSNHSARKVYGKAKEQLHARKDLFKYTS